MPSKNCTTLIAEARQQKATTLDLSHADGLSDVALSALKDLPQLEVLNLSGWSGQVSDRGLAVLTQLSQLRRLNLSWRQGVTDKAMGYLAKLDKLEAVDLLGTPTGDGALRALRNKPKLHVLKSGNLVTNAGLAMLHEFPVFKTWKGGDTTIELMSFETAPNFLLLRGAIDDDGVAALAGLDGVFGLSLDGEDLDIGPEGLQHLLKMDRLSSLAFDADDETMPVFADMPRLRRLMCQDTEATDEGFIALSRSRSIESIWGRRCYNLKGAGFRALGTMPKLRSLAVSCKNVDDEALAALPSFPALREFMPMDVPDAGFRHVGRCAQLEALQCMYCTDTGDLATSHLTDLTKLRTYQAWSTKITDKSLETLSRMPTLERIHLENCAAITDAGLAYLAKLPKLREFTWEMMPSITKNSVSASESKS